MDSVFQFNWFGNSSGIFAEKLRNYKTEKLFFFRDIQEEILHMDSIFQFYCIIGQEQLYNCFLMFFESLFITCHLFCIYYLYMVPPAKRTFQNLESRGQNVRETL